VGVVPRFVRRHFFYFIKRSKQIYETIKVVVSIVARDDCPAFGKNVGPTRLPLGGQLHRSLENITVRHRPIQQFSGASLQCCTQAGSSVLPGGG